MSPDKGAARHGAETSRDEPSPPVAASANPAVFEPIDAPASPVVADTAAIPAEPVACAPQSVAEATPDAPANEERAARPSKSSRWFSVGAFPKRLSGLADIARKLGPRAASVPKGRLVYAIGDVHGCAAQLDALLALISEDADALAPSAADVTREVVFLGDYVDRGPDSRMVMDRLLKGPPEGFQARFIKGNHEDAMLRFLDEPGFGAKWREYGGGATLSSYGVDLERERGRAIDWDDVRDQFAQALPDAHRTFLENLEPMAVCGDYVFVHAGVRPGVLLSEQSEHDLMWIRDEFLYDDSPLEKVVVHGHTPHNAPHYSYRRIGVDTGAYSTGVLTAARLFGETVGFLQARSGAPGE